ncbi:hypothetical protein ACN28E_06050 [Archangium lansingense]|uniref:hypothetical protein n=1 Tax=Archangium lansingense TaxID=2995310 RepID=UPI003B7724F2
MLEYYYHCTRHGLDVLLAGSIAPGMVQRQHRQVYLFRTKGQQRNDSGKYFKAPDNDVFKYVLGNKHVIPCAFFFSSELTPHYDNGVQWLYRDNGGTLLLTNELAGIFVPEDYPEAFESLVLVLYILGLENWKVAFGNLNFAPAKQFLKGLFARKAFRLRLTLAETLREGVRGTRNVKEFFQTNALFLKMIVSPPSAL